MDAELKISKIPGRYRLYPIIIGYRCAGYELQKEYKTIFGRIWKPVKGESGKIRVTKYDEKTLIEVAKQMEELADHLSTIKYIEFK
jgi:hypothetical protein